MSLQAPLNPNDTDTSQPSDKQHRSENCGYWPVLKNGNFVALWIGQIFSQIADRIIFVVFISLIVHHFGPSERYSSFLYIAFTIPAILLTAIAGVFVDRWPRKAVLISTNLLRALLVALIPWAANATGGWAIYLVAFLISAATQFFVPAEAATIPSLIPKENLLTANSLFTTTMMVALILGFALGDPLINLFSLHKVHWAITGLFILSSLSLMLINLPHKIKEKRDKEQESIQASVNRFIQEISEGFLYIRQNLLVRNAMLKLALLFSSMIALCILFISFAKSYLFEDPMVASRKFAYIIMCNGIGMAIGAFWLGHSFPKSRRGPMVFSGFTVVGLCLILLSFIDLISKHDHAFRLPTFANQFVYWEQIHFTWRMMYTYTMSITMGIGAAFVAIPLQALLQEVIPEDKRGKVFGVQFTILSTASTLPVLLAGLAVEVISVKTLFILIGAPIFLLGSIGFCNLAKGKNRDESLANW